MHVCLRLMRMRIPNSLRVLFHCGHFDRNEISFWMIKYNVSTTRNEMPTHVHQNIGPFRNVADMKRHVNRICFYAALKSQSGLTSFRLSCGRTLMKTKNAKQKKKSKTFFTHIKNI